MSIVYAKMAEWGDGSRAIVRIQWLGGDEGHVFNAVQVDGKTLLIDSQNPNRQPHKYFDSNVIESGISIARVDDKEFDEYWAAKCFTRLT